MQQRKMMSSGNRSWSKILRLLFLGKWVLGFVLHSALRVLPVRRGYFSTNLLEKGQMCGGFCQGAEIAPISAGSEWTFSLLSLFLSLGITLSASLAYLTDVYLYFIQKQRQLYLRIESRNHQPIRVPWFSAAALSPRGTFFSVLSLCLGFFVFAYQQALRIYLDFLLIVLEGTGVVASKDNARRNTGSLSFTKCQTKVLTPENSL